MATNTEAVVKSVHFILSPLGDDGQGGSLRRQNGIYAEVDHSRFVWRTALGAGGGKGGQAGSRVLRVRQHNAARCSISPGMG